MLFHLLICVKLNKNDFTYIETIMTYEGKAWVEIFLYEKTKFFLNSGVKFYTEYVFFKRMNFHRSLETRINLSADLYHIFPAKSRPF